MSSVRVHSCGTVIATCSGSRYWPSDAHHFSDQLSSLASSDAGSTSSDSEVAGSSISWSELNDNEDSAEESSNDEAEVTGSGRGAKGGRQSGEKGASKTSLRASDCGERVDDLRLSGDETSTGRRDRKATAAAARRAGTRARDNSIRVWSLE